MSFCTPRRNSIVCMPSSDHNSTWFCYATGMGLRFTTAGMSQLQMLIKLFSVWTARHKQLADRVHCDCSLPAPCPRPPSPLRPEIEQKKFVVFLRERKQGAGTPGLSIQTTWESDQPRLYQCP